MLLDLFAARAEGRRISVSSACIASGVATSTALRWVAQMELDGLVPRRPDPSDGRRTFLDISADTADAVERWLNTTFVH
ncbi:hypothetical protein [Sphingomonas sp.]|uniref:hypothetical protein n=1 Tax=Sphingomonas sp. TaxID=28214 RepID=UPI003AFF9046